MHPPVSSGRAELLTPSPVVCDGLAWSVAPSKASGILWVVCEDRMVFEAHRAALEALATEISIKNAVPPMPTVDPGRKQARKLSSKERALALVTDAVREAYAAGADARDIRLAVFSAMGLDSEPGE